MAVTTVKDIIARAKLVLQEIAVDGTRWTNNELIGWLNESYQAIVSTKPDASAVNEPLALVVGTKQSIPASGLRLLDVVRNTAATSNKGSIIVCARRQLDATRRNWHAETPTLNVEHFIFDEMDPTHFYVYPPAAAGAEVEIVYSQVPAPHGAYSASENDKIKLNDSYAPSMVDYILYRAFSKDAEFAGNAARAQGHYQVFTASLGNKVQIDLVASPNAQ